MLIKREWQLHFGLSRDKTKINMNENKTNGSAEDLQKSIRGREGRKNEELLKTRAAAQRNHDEAANVEIRGISRGRKGRNTISDARSQELAAIRIQSIQRGRLGRHKVAKKNGTVILTNGMIKKGLQTHGRHPILLKHTFLQLELPVRDC